MLNQNIAVFFTSEELQNLCLTLSDTLSWFDGLRFAVDDSTPINTEIDVQPLREFRDKLKNVAYLTV